MGLEFNQTLSVVQSIKQDERGTTELISTPDGSLFIRKYLKRDSSAAATYKQLEGLICPHLAQVYKVFDLGTTTVVIMEYCQGTTLRQLVDSNGPLTRQQAQTYLVQICQAVSFLHACPSAPIIHRDITPSNIVISHQSALLIDLGISRSFNPETHKDTKPLGTFGYAAPEQFGFAQSDERTDVYGLGATYYFMLTGHDPSQNMAETLVYSALPADVKMVIGMACEPQPAHRFQNITELVSAIMNMQETMHAAPASRTRIVNGNNHAPSHVETNPTHRTDDGTSALSKSVPSIVLKAIVGIAETILLFALVSFSLDGFSVLDRSEAAVYALATFLVIGGIVIGPAGLLAFIPEIYRGRWVFSKERGKRVGLSLLACFAAFLLGCILLALCPDGTIQAVQAFRDSR